MQNIKEMITQLVICLNITISKTIIVTGLNKQPALDADPKKIQQINFTGNLNRAESPTIFFIIEETKETVLDFSQVTVKVF